MKWTTPRSPLRYPTLASIWSIISNKGWIRYYLYLDQNKWVELLRAESGKGDPSIASIAVRIRTLVSSGDLIIPLSGANYMETWHRSNWQSRHALARLMRDLSNYRSLWPAQRVRQLECDRLVAAFMATSGAYEDQVPDALVANLRDRVIGRGVNHAFDSPTGRLRLVESIACGSQAEGPALEPTNDLLEIIEQYRMVPGEPYEWWSLAGPAGPIDMPEFEVGTQHRLGSSFATDEREFSRTSHDYAKSREHLEAILLFRELGHATEELSESAARLGMPIVNLAGELVRYAGREGVLRLLRQLPSRYATYSMRLAKHRNTQSRWSQHDLADIVALSVAAAYCSVVVAERQWAHILNQANVSRHFGTTVLSRLADLNEIL